MEEKDFILFESYLLGELSEAEQISFEDKLKVDIALQKSFNSYKEVFGLLENKFKDEAATNALTENLSKISDKHFKKASSVKVIQFKPWKYAVAASLILLLGITVFNDFFSKPSYSDFVSHEPLSLTVRGGQDEFYKQAEEAFNTANYIQAERLFSEILTNNPDMVELKLYRAISLIELNEYTTSDKILEDIAKNDSAYKYTAKWYLALSKLKQEQYNDCELLLKEIPANTDVYQLAQDLLGAL